MTMFTNVNTTAVPACCQTVQTTDRCASLWNAYSGRRSWQLKKTSRLSKILCETCKAYMEKFHQYKGWKSGMCYEQILNINQPKWFMPIIKHPETEKGHIFYDLE